ncbi:hypothetical protein [Evansella tamaricis]|uniref:Uncharacterized protein n=1 Tax=Evansella tamaricis TaxID=2069301 RepID=A0ABS6JDC3_9BACI|nr:hypothetical protein [Evansella tamaricis]MBU9711674.1 hypothetical protein [Evansella tamaricis]
MAEESKDLMTVKDLEYAVINTLEKHNKEHIGIVDRKELPDDIEFLEFETLEEFKRFLLTSELPQETAKVVNEKREDFHQKKPSKTSPDFNINNSYNHAASHQWVPDRGCTYCWQPGLMHIDYSFTAPQRTNPLYFTDITQITSWEDDIFSTWVNTIDPIYNISTYGGFTDVTITGYHLIGVSVGGFEVGYTESNQYSQQILPEGQTY